MARRKQQRKDAYFELSNCFNKNNSLPGTWSEYFGNDHGIHLELGCGHGDLSLEMARKYPGENFLGVDLKPDRMWRSAIKALDEGLPNLGFMCLHLLQLADHFGESEISSLWITFPDPFPKARQAKHRMINPQFLRIYRRVLKPDGLIQFKTDNLDLFHYGLEILVKEPDIRLHQLSFDLHENPDMPPDTKILTTYERRFLEMGMKINYVSFGFQKRNPAV